MITLFPRKSETMKYGLAILLVLITQLVMAQQFGGFPPSIKWKQIDSDTARVILMPGAEREAARIASIVHRMAADTTHALGKKLRKINIVLQSRTTEANGYVALAPFRSEYYLVPGSNIFDFGTLPWHEQLALHEYRHVQQYNNFNNGITKGFYFLFGEQGQAFANAITIPDWFFEGDAVHAETALTPSGRGRLPYFLSGYNSLWLERKNYNWQKLRNGSLKDYVPNHYQLGYLLANYGYLQYGPEFWKKVTQDASRFKGVFYPFQRAVKKHSGLSYKTFRTQALDFYKARLGAATDAPVLPSKKVTDYYFPQPAGRDSIVYLKRAFNRLPAFYIADEKGEHKIALRAISSEDWFSYQKGQIAYTAYSTHPRWSYIDYSDIVVMDVSTKKERRITHKTRYYTPDFSPSGEKLVAIRMNDSLQSSLELLDSRNGTVLQSWKQEGEFYVNPRFIRDDQVVVGIRTNDSKMSLVVQHLNGEREVIIPPGYHTLGQASSDGQTIYFTSNFNGNDDIYAYRLKEKKLFQLTTGFTGHYFPAVAEGSLVWSHFTTKGLELRRVPLDSLTWAEQNIMTTGGRVVHFPVALEKNIMSMRTERFSTKRYDRGTRLVNFHSWAPSYATPEFSFSFYSDNILNTFSNQLFYRYNENERSHAVGWNTSYGGLFPKLNAGIEYIFDRSFLTTAGMVYYDQYELRIGYNIPLNFTRGTSYKLLNFGSNYVYTEATPKGTSRQIVRGSSTGYLHHFINASQYRPVALQHIYPKLGYAFAVHHRHRLDDRGSQFLANMNVFLPSIANHSIVLQGSWQETDTNNVIFTNRFAYARGYDDDFFFSRMWKLGANYHFPLLYPDLGFASIVYFQRLRGNLFYDFMRVYSRNKQNTADLRSVGAELFFDTKWWNQLPVSFGVGLSYLLDDGFSNNDRRGNTRFSIILPLELIPN